MTDADKRMNPQRTLC